MDSPESEHNNLSDNDLKNQLQFGDEQDIQILGKPKPIKNPRNIKAGKKALRTRMQRDEVFRK
ncbi:MAG: hypothetical protein HUJ61_04960, partial [Bacilli bacterium]|nr:hypothetical protein [Bacilli bacterium]